MRARLPLLVCAGLVALTVTAYAPLWRNDFIDLDDELYVTRNEEVTQGLTWRGVAWAWTTFHAGFYFPLTWMSLQVDAGLFPLRDAAGRRLPNPAAFHGQNLLWHAATVLLLFEVLRRMTGALWRSAAVAALFAVHPLHVESVAWATERKDVLSAFFWVLSMLAYERWVRSGSRAWHWALLLAFLLGLLSKPMLVTLPFALLLLDVWPLRRLAAGGPPGGAPEGQSASVNLRSAVVEKLPLFALSAGACWLAVVTQRHAGAVASPEAAPLSARLANAVVSCAWYLEKTLWPAGLAVFYPHPGTRWAWPPVLQAAALLALVSLAAALLGRRMPWLAVGWLWFLGTLVPVLGLVQVGQQARGDRFAYVPHIGLFVALVWAAADLLARLRVPAAAQGVLAGGVLAALTAASARQVAFWRDTPTVWERALAVTPDNDKAHLSLAGYFTDQARRESSPQRAGAALGQARDHAARAVAIRPKPLYLYNLGAVCLLQGDLDAAAEALEAAVRERPDQADWWHNLGMVRLRQRRPAEAVEDFRRALEGEREQASAPAWLALPPAGANTRANLGMALWQLGRHDEARACWDEALRASPAEAVALRGVGLDLLRQGQVKPAAERLAALVRSAPALAAAHSDLGVALGRLSDWSAAASHRRAIALETNHLIAQTTPDRRDLALYRRRLAFTLREFAQDQEAAAEYREALRLDPAWPARCAAEAWELATAPHRAPGDAAEAYELASQACQAAADPPAEALDALAAAHAAAGRFEAAVGAARRALLKAGPGQAEAIRRRLRGYEQGKPFVRGG
jgi:tetratricopeptide (TPR) repeat protein